MGSRQLAATAVVMLVALSAGARARAYCWPLKPFHRMHAIRGAFDDPRFHLDAEGAVSAFHFGVDIAARDGTRVYAVAGGYVHSYRSYVTVSRRNGREFGYWHVRPAVHTGQHVRAHQLLGWVGRGWGHVHFAESFHGQYRNPLRRGALTPYVDHLPPVVASIGFVSGDGTGVDPSHVRGTVDVEAEVYDLPAVRLRPPWQVARLTPAFIWWKLFRGDVPETGWTLAVDFDFALMPQGAYQWTYAPGSYQNKPNRPGRYLFWITRELDTRTLPDGRYRLVVLAEDTRFNAGSGAFDFTVANGAPPVPPSYAPGIVTQFRHPE